MKSAKIIIKGRSAKNKHPITKITFMNSVNFLTLDKPLAFHAIKNQINC